MKKILSILLAVTLLIGCCSIGMTAFAADVDASSAIAMMNSKISVAVNGDSTVEGSAPVGYIYDNQYTSNAFSVKDNNNQVPGFIAAYYPEYNDLFTAENSNPSTSLTAMFDKMFGFKNENVTINKSVKGADVIGAAALKEYNLTSDDVTSIEADGSVMTIYLPDVNLMNYGEIEASGLIKVLDDYITSDEAKNLVTDFAKRCPTSDLENVELGYSNIALNLTFDDEVLVDAANNCTCNGPLYSVSLSYTLSGSAIIYHTDLGNPIQLSNSTSFTRNYYGFQTFDPTVDINAYDLANMINDATAYVNYDKAGYNYARTSQYTTAPVVDIDPLSAPVIGEGNTDESKQPTYDTINMVLGVIVGAIGEIKFQNTITGVITDAIEVGDKSVAIEASENAGEKIGNDKYAVKSTTIKANTFKTIEYNPTTGIITFTLNDVVNPSKTDSELSQFTNDFVSGEEVRNRFNIGLNDELNTGISVLKDTDPCDITYTGITGYVKFEGATADNPFGTTGHLDKYNIIYATSLYAKVSSFRNLTITCATKLSSIAKNFEYVDYEQGDVDQSTRVAIVDAKLVLKYVAGTAELTKAQLDLADMNGDGLVTIVDAKLILKKVAATVD